MSQFARLPTEILLMVVDQLPLATRACLALTCKLLYEDLGYILKDDELPLPRTLVPKRR